MISYQVVTYNRPLHHATPPQSVPRGWPSLYKVSANTQEVLLCQVSPTTARCTMPPLHNRRPGDDLPSIRCQTTHKGYYPASCHLQPPAEPCYPSTIGAPGMTIPL
ncbi:hypothetical protein J6590_047566 [Homalodisca vitripennis]|nr:hypothetical protein J6590_047566 [Homalodisca vitripennis]